MKAEEIGAYLKKLRLEQNLTQKELAEKLFITHQAVSSWEKGKTLPDINTLSQLGDFYNITIDNLLLKEGSVDDVNDKQQKSMIPRRIFAFIGLLFSIICMSIFFNYSRHIVTYIVFTVLLMIISLLYSFLLKQRNNKLEYLITTGLILLISIILFASNARYYMLNETKYLQMTEEIEILYPREFEQTTESVQYNYIFDTYALIYTDADADIDIFNLTNYYEGEYTTIDTGTMKIYDLIVVDNEIYFSTFDEKIPGAFELYTLDFESKEYTLIFESNEVLRMYKVFEQVFLVSDPYLENTTNIYQYNLDNNTVSEPITVDYTIFSMSEYFVEYESYFIMSTMYINPSDNLSTIALFDYEFELQHVLYEGEVGEVINVESNYGKVLAGTNEGALYFKDLSYEVIGEDYAQYPEILSPEYIRINDKIYYANDDTNKIELASNVLFYDADYYPQGAKFLIEDDSSNFYAIDNELIGYIQFIPYEIEEVFLPSYMRVISLILGISTYGLFATIGHKRK